MSVLHANRPLADWSHIGVAEFASCLVSFSCGPDCLLGKTLQDRVLSITQFPEHHRSARRSPSFRKTVANGVTTESRLARGDTHLCSYACGEPPELAGDRGPLRQGR